MSKWKLWAALLALAGMLFAPWALAQSSTQDGRPFGQVIHPELNGGMVDADSTAKAWRATSAGALQNSDVSRDRNYNTLLSIMDRDTLSVGMADSSTVIAASDLLHGGLLFIVNGGGTQVRLAVRVFVCMNGQTDTLSRVIVPPFASTANDTVTVGKVVLPTSVQNNLEELPVEFVNTGLGASKWGYQMSKLVPLSRFGFFNSLYATHIQVVVRCLSKVGGSTAGPRVRVWYMGSPL